MWLFGASALLVLQLSLVSQNRTQSTQSPAESFTLCSNIAASFKTNDLVISLVTCDGLISVCVWVCRYSSKLWDDPGINVNTSAYFYLGDLINLPNIAKHVGVIEMHTSICVRLFGFLTRDDRLMLSFIGLQSDEIVNEVEMYITLLSIDFTIHYFFVCFQKGQFARCYTMANLCRAILVQPWIGAFRKSFNTEGILPSIVVHSKRGPLFS